MRRSGRFFLLVGLIFECLLCSLSPAYGQADPQKRQVTDNQQPAEHSASPGNYYALVIGIADYQVEPHLMTPVNDATELAALLKDQYGFKVQTLLDSQATRLQIFGALDHYRNSLAAEDNLLIYFAGHGLSDKMLDQAYWAPVDAGKDTYANWITASDITSEARATPARHILIISDSCYSGMLSREIEVVRAGESDSAKVPEQVFARKSRSIFSSGGDEPVWDGDAPGQLKNHSVFANVLLHSLSEYKSSQFTGNDLFVQVRHLVGGRSPQLPTYSTIRNSLDEGGDFVFSRQGARIDPGPEVKREIEDYLGRKVNPEQEGVYTALDRYALAFSSMDIRVLKQAWPSINRQQEKATKEAWKQPGLKAVILQLRNRSPIKVENNTAALSADEWVVYTFNGTQRPPQTNRVEVLLAKDTQGGWTVSNLKGTP